MKLEISDYEVNLLIISIMNSASRKYNFVRMMKKMFRQESDNDVKILYLQAQGRSTIELSTYINMLYRLNKYSKTLKTLTREVLINARTYRKDGY